MTSIVVISAGLSVPSSTRILADALGAATARALRAPSVEHLSPPVELVETTEVTVVELRELAHLLTDNVLTGFPTGALADAVRRVAEADAVIAVTPVYAGSYSGLFKMFFDVLEEGTLEGKPILIAATAGTARHSLVLEFAMRPLFAYLRADVVPTGVFAASEDFGAGAVTGGSLSARIDRAAGELADKVLRRGTTLPEDPFETPTPFEDLLNDLH
jgi:FMN reductase